MFKDDCNDFELRSFKTNIDFEPEKSGVLFGILISVVYVAAFTLVYFLLKEL